MTQLYGYNRLTVKGLVGDGTTQPILEARGSVDLRLDHAFRLSCQRSRELRRLTGYTSSLSDLQTLTVRKNRYNRQSR